MFYLMHLPFVKFQGTGNDFIIIDDSSPLFDPTGKKGESTVARLCSRHTGIGADGLIILRKDTGSDFQMQYFNSDGREGSLCGNGSRCAAAYAFATGFLPQREMKFRAADGMHSARILKTGEKSYEVSVTLKDAPLPERIREDEYFINTGSPHLVLFREDIGKTDIYREGKRIRNSAKWQPEGVNVNFASVINRDEIRVSTYERGVENLTLSCGTGVTAAAIAAAVYQQRQAGTFKYTIVTNGGRLSVSFNLMNTERGPIRNIELQGPAVFVFKGEVLI